jgi:hypothetical protein
MINYKPSHSSLFLILALLSACTLNADVHDNNLNTPDPPTNGGTGGSSVVPNPEDGGTAGTGGSAEGGSAGVGGDTSEGGSENYPDAGVAGSAGEAGTGNVANDAGTDPDPVVRVCNTPQAIGSDKGNWFTTNTLNTEFRSHWFQLIDTDGFVDSCTYVGRIKWYQPVTDQLGYVWYDSVGLIDNPITILTIHFDDDGSVSDVIRSDGLVLPGMGYSHGICYPTDMSERDQAYYGLDREYQLKHCFYNKLNYHGLGFVGIFRGAWANDFSKPVLLDLLSEPPVDVAVPEVVPVWEPLYPGEEFHPANYAPGCRKDYFPAECFASYPEGCKPSLSDEEYLGMTVCLELCSQGNYSCTVVNGD